MFIWKNKGKLNYLEIEEFKEAGVLACFTSRSGGTSQGSYSSLNLGLHTGDENKKVLANRRLVAEAFGLNCKDFIVGEQVHDNKVYLADYKDLGRGAFDHSSSIPGVDALITDKPGIPLVSFYADCVPLFIMDPVKKIVALVHSGWKGTSLKIGAKTVEKMKNIFNIEVNKLYAAIGPSISRDYYEVDSCIINIFKEKFKNYNDFIVDKGKDLYLLDLQAANIFTFIEAGVSVKQIISCDLCTYCEQKHFYSYRRDGKSTGRMASIIVKEYRDGYNAEG
ncbi:MAG TPA: peptidoglycan editing factor PgeF [Halanaerobiales bacterium]|nr:peptidoglycan editing factor PgeF [Halanaerobiales bacterium]